MNLTLELRQGRRFPNLLRTNHSEKLHAFGYFMDLRPSISLDVAPRTLFWASD